MTPFDDDALRESIASWVLGAIPAEEEADFVAALEVCGEPCREEVAALQFVADVLPLATMQIEPPDGLTERVMAEVHREAELFSAADGSRADTPPARRERWWGRLVTRPALAGALATVLIGAGVAGGVVLSGGEEASRTTRVAATVDDSKAPGASAVLVRSGDDADLRVASMPPPPKGRVYMIWVKRDGEQPQGRGVFTVDRHGRGAADVAGSLKGVDAVLVTDEPEGGSQIPSRQPMLRAKLS